MSDEATIDRLALDLTALRKKAREGRRAFAQSVESAFVKVMKRTMLLYLKVRGQGVSREDGIQGIELELRAAWPKGVSKFNLDCDSCDDTGWTEHTCWDQHRCGRKLCAVNPEKQHLYVEPCGCAKGDRMRKRVQSVEDAIAAAGRTSKRKAAKWSPVGQ